MNCIRAYNQRTATASFYCRAYRRFVLGTIAGVMVFPFAIAAGHEPQFQQPSEPSATSILDSPVVDGRIGGYQYEGSLKPTPGVNSRFSNAAKYGSAGNIVGVDRNADDSRFPTGGSGRFQSKMDYQSVFSLRNEMQRAQAEKNASARKNGKFDSGAPRLVTAHEPSRIPYAKNRRPAYGKYPDELLAQQNSPVAPSPDATVPAIESAPNEMLNAPQLLWMRGRAPQATGSVYDPWGNLSDYHSLDADPYYESNDYGYDPTGFYENPLGGALNLNNNVGGAISFPPLPPTPEETQQAFLEYLEAQLLRSPDVNPLSPIQVSYQGGTVTVRGIVPTPAARVAAGNILLSDPRVSKVNNLMTCLRNDNVGPNASTETKATQQNVPNGQAPTSVVPQ